MTKIVDPISTNPILQSLNFTDNFAGTPSTMYYKKVGNVYFDFYFIGSGCATVICTGDNDAPSAMSDSIARLALMLGILVSSSITRPSYTTIGIPEPIKWDPRSSRWTGSSNGRPGNALSCIIST